MIYDEFIKMGEYAAAGMYEEPDRNLFYRKALGLRRYYENCRLAEYNGELLYPSGKLPCDMSIYPFYLEIIYKDYYGEEYEGFADWNEELKDRFINDFCKYSPSVPVEHIVGGSMYTHSMPHYERVLKEGLLSYIPRIEKIEDKDMKEGLLHVIEGIKNYIERSVSYLKEKNADEKLINALLKVPLYPAENMYEAVMAWNFVCYLDNSDNLGCVASGLYPYYDGEDATPLLRNLFENLDACGGWSMSLGTDYNPLTLQCLEATKGIRRPMTELFINDDTPDEVWEKAFEVIRTNNGQPAFYNEKLVLDGLQKRFPIISDEDIKKFCGGGCTESMIAGLSNVGSLDAGINLPLILEEVINERLQESKDFEEFYNDYVESVESVVENIVKEISTSQIERAKYNPAPMRTLLIDDCIDKGIDYNAGGARYKWSIVNFAGMINVIDSMLVIRDLVFEDKKIRPEEFIRLLKSNDKEFLNKVRNYDVCFGKDNEEANEFANRLSADIFKTLDDKETPMCEGVIPACIQFNSQIWAGTFVGATPDGREEKSPLCDSLVAIFGKDTEGPTALLKSIASLDLKSALGIPVVNFNINPDFKDETLKALIMGYLKLGGMHMQITCASAEMLQKAYENPDMYKNLVVRVGGYSEYFHLLSDDLKKFVINRTIQKME